MRTNSFAPRSNAETYAAGVAELDRAALVVGLRLQHADAVVQLLGDCLSASAPAGGGSATEWTHCHNPGSRRLRAVRISVSTARCDTGWTHHSRLPTPTAYESWLPTKVTFPKLRSQSWMRPPRMSSQTSGVVGSGGHAPRSVHYKWWPSVSMQRRMHLQRRKGEEKERPALRAAEKASFPVGELRVRGKVRRSTSRW